MTAAEIEKLLERLLLEVSPKAFIILKASQRDNKGMRK